MSSAYCKIEARHEDHRDLDVDLERAERERKRERDRSRRARRFLARDLGARGRRRVAGLRERDFVRTIRLRFASLTVSIGR